MIGFKVEPPLILNDKSIEILQLQTRAKEKIDSLIQELSVLYAPELNLVPDPIDYSNIREERFFGEKNHQEEPHKKSLYLGKKLQKETAEKKIASYQAIFDEISQYNLKNPSCSYLYSSHKELGYALLLLKTRKAIHELRCASTPITPLKTLADQLEATIKLLNNPDKQKNINRQKQKLWRLALSNCQKELLSCAKFPNNLPHEIKKETQTPLLETSEEIDEIKQCAKIASWSKKVMILGGVLVVLGSALIVWRDHGHDSIAQILQKLPATLWDIIIGTVAFVTIMALVMYCAHQEVLGNRNYFADNEHVNDINKSS